MAFADGELQDICQKIYDFASVLCQKQRTKYLNRETHKMQNELQNLKEIKPRESGYENSERLFADIKETCNRQKEKMQRTHERKMETFYHLENLDLEKEEFAKLRINVERQ